MTFNQRDFWSASVKNLFLPAQNANAFGGEGSLIHLYWMKTVFLESVLFLTHAFCHKCYGENRGMTTQNFSLGQQLKN